jgi:hypothetical protein
MNEAESSHTNGGATEDDDEVVQPNATTATDTTADKPPQKGKGKGKGKAKAKKKSTVSPSSASPVQAPTTTAPFDETKFLKTVSSMLQVQMTEFIRVQQQRSLISEETALSTPTSSRVMTRSSGSKSQPNSPSKKPKLG